MQVDRLAETVTTEDGRVLMFAEYGPGDGTPVVSFHGTPNCRLRSESVERLVSELGIRLITYDRPGCGGSDRMAGRTVADSAGDARRILDALGLERSGVHGASGGTPPAMAFAALCPGRVTRLALQAPLAPYRELGHDLWSQGQDEQVKEYMGLCLQGEAGAARAINKEVEELVADPDWVEVTREAVRQGPWGAVDDELAQLSEWGFDPASIAAPTLIIYDPDETVLPPQHPRWLGDRIPDATLMTTSTLGHRASDEDPDPDRRHMYRWLTG
jgi:pimeloyl-ACP methyl ester carboxylesterase